MKYAIELYYDKETEQKLFNLAKRVADEKLSTKFLEWKTRPHLTLACFNDVNEVKCIQQLKNFAQTHKPMPAYIGSIATVYKGNIIKNLIMDCQSYTKYRPNETTGGIFVSWRRKEELPTGA